MSESSNQPIAMRPCPHCGREIPNDVSRCRYCFARVEVVREVLPNLAANAEDLSRSVATKSDISTRDAEATVRENWAASVERRYTDAYLVGRAIDGWGGLVKS